MKTLKKSLALVLAVVMVVGVLAISASAATYNDDAQIQYKEAVEVLSLVGVIDGKENNNFDPTGTLTRQEAAKIVTYIINQKSAEALSKTSSFTDVTAGSWAAGYISYCASQGIIAGTGSNKFEPTGTLTGTAWAKIILCALGYNAEVEGFTNANWAVNVTAKSEELGLTDGITGFDYDAAITREEACQMAFNAFDEITKTYSNNGGQNITVSGSDVNVSITTGGSYTDGKTLEAKYFSNLEKNVTTDAFKRPGTKYTNTTSKKSVFVADEAVLTYENTEVTAKTIYSALSLTDVATAEYYVDGTAKTGIELKASSTTAVGGYGTNVEIYKIVNNDKTVTYRIVEIQEHFDTVDTVTTTKDKDTGKSTTTLTLKTTKLSSTTITGFEKKTAVVYTVAGSAIQTMAKANAITGSVTASASGYVRVDGEKYTITKGSGLEAGKGLLAVNSAATNTYYLDSYNNIIAVVEGETADVENNYIYVLNVAAKAATSKAGDLFAESTDSAAAAQAQVLDLSTGEISIVDQAVVKTDKGYFYANAAGTASGNEVKDIPAADEYASAIYAYTTLDDGSIVLGDVADTVKVTLKAKEADIDVTGAYANSSTVVTVVEKSYTNGKVTSAKVTTYTGIANFPTFTNQEALVIKNSNGLVSSIIIVKDAKTSSAVNYAVYAGAGETDSTGTKHAFYVNGEQVEYYSNLTFTKDAVYDITVSGTEVKEATAKTGTKATISAIDSTFVVAGDKVVYLASSVAVYDSTNNYAAAEISVDDTVTYYTNTDGQIDLIIIVAAE
jgi:hypothetical protein